MEQRLEQQQKQVHSLKTKLKLIEESLRGKQQHKDRIIERRVEELLDPDIDWNSLQPGTATSPVAQNPDSGIPPLRMPTSGTPTGLPKPPHLPGTSHSSLVRSSPITEDSSDHATADQDRLTQRLVLRRKAVDEQSEAMRSLETNYRPEHTKVVRAVETLNHRMAEWKQTWREYEALIRDKELEIAMEETRQKTMRAESEKITEQAKRGYSSSVEVALANTKLRQTELRQRKAEVALQLLKSIATKAPHLNPTNYPSENSTPAESVDRPK